VNPFAKIKVISVFGVLCTALFLGLLVWSPRFVDERIESLFLDLRFQLRNLLAPPPIPRDIVIVEVDERSLEIYGRWPWSRVRQAWLIDRIMLAEPKVLAVDIFYPEREGTLADSTFVRTLRKHEGRIVLAAGFDTVQGIREPPDYLFDNAVMNVQDASLMRQMATVTKLKLSIDPISSQAALGHVFSPADLDGKLRWEYLTVKYEEDLYPSLALITAAMAQDRSIEDIVVFGGRGARLGDTYMETDRAGRMRIDFLGPERTIPYLSAADVLGGTLDPVLMKDKIVLLGTSAISTFDFVVTPFSARMPGVEKNATVIENIIHRRFLRSVPLSVVAFLVVASGLFLAFLLPQVRAQWGLLTSGVILLLYYALNQYLFTWQGYYANFIYPFGNMLVIGVFAAGYKYLTEERKAKELRKMFSHYVSPKIVEQLIANPDMAKLGGYRKEITVLFSDVRGFTTFSEKRKPEEVVEHLNEYLHEMTNIIFKWEGTLDKFVGDEIMAFWGAPLDQPNHAELALKCALNMSDRLEELQAKWRAEGKEPLDNGIGLNTGDVLVGNIGSADKKMDYTIIGDHVNLGARVETLTRKYDARVLFTEFTYEKIRHLVEEGKLYRVDMKQMDTVKVKGKDIPVRIYAIHSVRKAS
jgi:adenylate cyclase